MDTEIIDPLLFFVAYFFALQIVACSFLLAIALSVRSYKRRRAAKRTQMSKGSRYA